MPRDDLSDGDMALIQMSMPLAWLNLSTRASQLATDLGVVYLGELAGLNPGQLRRRPNVGAKTITELEGWLGRAGLSFGAPRQGWSAAQAEVAVAGSAELLADFAARLNDLGGVAPTTIAGALRQALVEAGASERNIDLVVDYFGWGGDEPKTLESVGDELGITRERVRQIVAKATNRMRQRLAPQPLRRAIARVTKAIPLDALSFDRLLFEGGWADGRFSPLGLRHALEIYRLEVPFEVGIDGALLPIGANQAAQRASVVASRMISARGCVHIEELADADPDLRKIGAEAIALILNSIPRFKWLDAERKWLWRGVGDGAGRNRLVNAIGRIMAAAGKISLSELRAALRRNLRMGGFAPPLAILTGICRDLPFAEVTGGEITRIESACDWGAMLGRVESILFSVLTEFGPVMSRMDLLQKCLDRGMNLNTFGVSGTYSVILSRPVVGFYSLVGANIPPGTIEDLKRDREKASAFVDSGWTTTGMPFLCWQVSTSILYNGLANVPAGMQDVLQGQWAYLLDGRSSDGHFEVRGAVCWNIRKLLVGLGAEVGDLLAIWFDLDSRTIQAVAGSDELLDLVATGAPGDVEGTDEVEAHSLEIPARA
jgi:hypothetical protein